MNTRNNPPFPVTQCETESCNRNVPKSARGDYCTSCDNFRQIFGVDPRDVDTVDVELTETQLTCCKSNWIMHFVIDGERRKRGEFSSKEHAEMRKRDFESATHIVDKLN